jgi:ankyrin repeat protein
MNCQKAVDYIIKGDLFSLKNEMQNFRGNFTDECGNTFMHIAAINGKDNILSFLYYDMSLSMNIRNNEGDTPLSLACKWGQLKTVKMISFYSSNVKNINIHGYTPLLLSHKMGNYEISKFLIINFDVNCAHVSNDGYNVPQDFINNAIAEKISKRNRFRIQRHVNRENNSRRIILDNVVEEKTLNSQVVTPHFFNEHKELLVSSGKECAICYNKYEKNKVVIMECFHHLCTECYSNDKVKNCPLCRKNIK